MVWRGLLLFSSLLFLTVSAQGKDFAISSDLLQSAFHFDEPAPIPAEPASYDADTVELCFDETAICPWADYDSNYDGIIDYVSDDYFVSEFDCKPKGANKGYDGFGYGSHSVIERSAPAGFCVVTRASYFPSPNTDGPGLPLPSGPSTQSFSFKLDAFCMLRETAHKHNCDLEGFQGAVLDVSGIVINDAQITIDRDPRKWPTLKCAGETLGARKRQMAPRGNDTTTDEDRMQRMGLKRKGSKWAKGQTGHADGPSGTGTAPTQASVMNKGYHADHEEGRHHGNYESTTTPQTYYRGPGYIYTGVVYAHNPQGKGLVAAGTFEYVRPEFVPSDTTDANLIKRGWEILTSAPGKVYTPFQYNFKLTRGSLAKEQAYPPTYGSRR